MPDDELAFTTPVGAPACKRWKLYSPLTRISIFVRMNSTLSGPD